MVGVQKVFLVFLPSYMTEKRSLSNLRMELRITEQEWFVPVDLRKNMFCILEIKTVIFVGEFHI